MLSDFLGLGFGLDFIWGGAPHSQTLSTTGRTTTTMTEQAAYEALVAAYAARAAAEAKLANAQTATVSLDAKYQQTSEASALAKAAADEAWKTVKEFQLVLDEAQRQVKIKIAELMIASAQPTVIFT
jgi:thiamine biosynthesis lipoprotein ApbE